MEPKDSRYRTIFHLYLNYYYAWITMGKVALVTIARTKLRRHMYPLSQPPEPKQAILRQSQSCAKAARKLLLLFETVTRNRMITRFSFTDFQGCSIATIVTLVSGITERDSGYNARVSFGLDCLGKMSTGNMTAKMGVKFVEAVKTITDEAREKLQAAIHVTRTHEPRTSTPASVCDYNRWAEWFTEQERSQIPDQRPPEEENIVTGHDVLSSQTSLQSDVSNIETMSSWRTENEQFGLHENLLQQNLPMVRDVQYPDYDFSSALQNDDATFLMGLTGLDVLDFSGFR
jgi:nicotinamidase-related amidase